MKNKPIVIGVMGPGGAPRQEDIDNAYQLGSLIAQKNWLTLSGGRNMGVMNAVSKGASESGGVAIGLAVGKDASNLSDAVNVPIITGMGSGRNYINVLSSDVVVACGIATGTASEIALALKSGKDVILLDHPKESIDFFKKLEADKIHLANTPEETIEICEKLI